MWNLMHRARELVLSSSPSIHMSTLHLLLCVMNTVSCQKNGDGVDLDIKKFSFWNALSGYICTHKLQRDSAQGWAMLHNCRQQMLTPSLHHAFISCLFRPSTLTACSLMRVDILSRQASSSSTLSSQDTSCTMLPVCWPVQPRKLTPELKQTSNPWPGWPFTISKGKYKEFSSITITKQRNKTPHLSPNISCIYSLLKKGW